MLIPFITAFAELKTSFNIDIFFFVKLFTYYNLKSPLRSNKEAGFKRFSAEILPVSPLG
jgi:hypothetical protein